MIDVVALYNYIKKLLHNFSASIKFFHDWTRNDEIVTVNIYETDEYGEPIGETPTTLIIPSLKAIEKNHFLENTGISSPFTQFFIRTGYWESAAANFFKLIVKDSQIYKNSDVNKGLIYGIWNYFSKTDSEEQKNILIYPNKIAAPAFSQILTSGTGATNETFASDGDGYYATNISGPYSMVGGFLEVTMNEGDKEMVIPGWDSAVLLFNAPPNYAILPYKMTFKKGYGNWTQITYSGGSFNSTTLANRDLTYAIFVPDEKLWNFFNSLMGDYIAWGSGFTYIAETVTEAQRGLRYKPGTSLDVDMPNFTLPYQSARYSVIYLKSRVATNNEIQYELVFDNMKNTTLSAFECEGDNFTRGTIFIPIFLAAYTHTTHQNTDVFVVEKLDTTRYSLSSFISRAALWASLDTTPAPMKEYETANLVPTATQKVITGIMLPMDNVFLSTYSSPAFNLKLHRVTDIVSGTNYKALVGEDLTTSEEGISLAFAPGWVNTALEFGSIKNLGQWTYIGHNSLVPSTVDSTTNKVYNLGYHGSHYDAIPVNNLPKLITQHLTMNATGKWRYASIRIVDGFLTRVRTKVNARFDNISFIDNIIPIPQDITKKWNGDSEGILDNHGHIMDGGHLSVKGSVGVGLYEPKNETISGTQSGTFEVKYLAELKAARRPAFIEKKVGGTWWEVEAVADLYKWDTGTNGKVTIDVSETGDGSQTIEDVVVGIILVINGIPILFAPALKYETYWNVLGYMDDPNALFPVYIQKLRTAFSAFGYGKVPIFYNGYTIPKNEYIHILGYNKPYETTMFGVGWFFGGVTEKTFVDENGNENTYKLLIPFIFPDNITNDINELLNIENEQYRNGNFENILIDFSTPLVEDAGRAVPQSDRWKWALILRREIAKIFSNETTITSPVAVSGTGTSFVTRSRTGYEWIGGARMRVEAPKLLSLNYPYAKELNEIIKYVDAEKNTGSRTDQIRDLKEVIMRED